MYRTDGTGSLRSWICTRSAEGDRSAYHQARVARALPAYPRLSEALHQGWVSAAHVRLLLSLADLDGTGDGDLVALGQRHSVPQLETICRAARRDHRRTDQEGHQRRFVAWRCDDSGTFTLRGRLHGTDGLTVTNLLASIAEDTDAVDPATGAHEAFEACCADALVAVCTAPDGTPTERGEVVIHAPLSALGPDGEDGATGGTGMTWDGIVVSHSALRRLACDTRLRRTLEDDQGGAVGIGRRSRTISKWLLTQVRWRDQTCRFPGCEHTRWLHGHHLRHWADGGPTDLGNLVLLCPGHHRAVHEGGWRLDGHPDRTLTFTGPTGRSHTTHAAHHPHRSRPSRPRRRPGPVTPNGP